MKSLVDRLASYAEYHRDKRNIATHFVGIPMILVGTQADARADRHRPDQRRGRRDRARDSLLPRARPDATASVIAGLLGATCAAGTAHRRAAAADVGGRRRRAVRRRLGAPVPRPLLRGQEARVPRRPDAASSTARCSSSPRSRSRSACRPSCAPRSSAAPVRRAGAACRTPSSRRHEAPLGVRDAARGRHLV